MNKNIAITVNDLKHGNVLKIDETLDPSLLELSETDLHFSDPIRITGEAYLADDHVVLHLNVATTAKIPCSICNTATPCPLSLNPLYLSLPIEELSNGLYDCTSEIRESLLLQAPSFLECNNGKCPERTTVAPFLKSPSPPPSPFANLDQE